MIKFNRLPPQNGEDVELSEYTKREIISTLDFHRKASRHLQPSAQISTGESFKIFGSEVGTTISANLYHLSPADRISLTKVLAQAALLKSFVDIPEDFLAQYTDGAVGGAETEILGQQMQGFEDQI